VVLRLARENASRGYRRIHREMAAGTEPGIERERAGLRMAVPIWLSDAVLYQVYPQSFADSDGDGVGDLRGIAEHLDYLAWLGVTAVWLNPCFVSPMRDAGYDVADYFTVDPRYGDNAAYHDALTAIGEPGHIALPTANHDFARLCNAPRTPEQLPSAFAFQLTFPTLPAIYYGDEIGMRYVPGLPDTEGSVMVSGYNRAGSRTPMQWDSSPNAGFSVGPAACLYLPVDPDPQRPTVAGQRAGQNSLLHTVKDLIALRRAHPELGPGGSLEILNDGYPLAYLRGGQFLVIINPCDRAHVLLHDRPELASAIAVKQVGVTVDRITFTAGPFSFGIFHL
jgi:glycosidase